MLRYNYIITCCLFLINVKSEVFHIDKLNSFKFHIKPKLISPQFTIAYCKDIINKELKNKNEKNIRNNNINEEYNFDDKMMLDYIKINNNELKREKCLKLYESLELLGINAKNDSEVDKLYYKYEVNDIEIKYLNIKNNISNSNSNNKNIPYLNNYNNDLIFNESNINNSEILFCNIIYNQRTINNITLDIENNNYIYTREECISKYYDKLETNYFQMIINKLDDIIYEYDISLAKFWFTLFIMNIIRNN